MRTEQDVPAGDPIQAGTQLSFAEWRQEPPKPPQLKERLRRLPWFYLGCVVAWFLVIAILSVIQEMLHLKGVVQAMSTGSAVFVVAYLRLRQAPQSVRELLDLPSEIDQYPVSVDIFCEGQKMGSDLGVVTFVDDALHFEGRRTSFSFSNEITQGKTISLKEKQKGRSIAIPWRAGGQSGLIAFGPFDTVPGVGKGYLFKFVRDLAIWKVTPQTKQASTRLPPRYPAPTFLVKLERDRKLINFGLLAFSLILLVSLFDFLSHGVYSAGAVWALISTLAVSLTLYAKMRDRKLLAEARLTEQRFGPKLDRPVTTRIDLDQLPTVLTAAVATTQENVQL
jgi:hypothetical protein